MLKGQRGKGIEEISESGQSDRTLNISRIGKKVKKGGHW